MTGPNETHDGTCRCGQVRFRVKGVPILTMACHCTGCQRMTASAFSLSVLYPSASFEVVQGEPVIGGLHGATRHFFCPHCMSWLFTRMPGMDWQTVTVLSHAAQVINIAEVELGINTHGKQVHRQIDDIDIASAFAIAKQRSFDAVSPRHHAELRGGHAAATIIVRVQRQDDLVPITDGAMKPLDDVPIHVGGVALHRGW